MSIYAIGESWVGQITTTLAAGTLHRSMYVCTCLAEIAWTLTAWIFVFVQCPAVIIDKVEIKCCYPPLHGLPEAYIAGYAKATFHRLAASEVLTAHMAVGSYLRHGP